jgi:hypothetical protein
LTQLFDIKGICVREILGKEKIVATCDKKLCIIDYCGKILCRSIKAVCSIGITHSDWRNCYFYNDERLKEGTIFHAVRDANEFIEYPCNDGYFSSPSDQCGAQKLLFVMSVDKIAKKACLDFQGKILKYIPMGYSYEFLPNNRALILTNYQTGDYKKCILYPKGADEHLKQLAHSSLTMTKYVALEKWYGEIEKERKKLLELKA